MRTEPAGCMVKFLITFIFLHTLKARPRFLDMVLLE